MAESTSFYFPGLNPKAPPFIPMEEKVTSEEPDQSDQLQKCSSLILKALYPHTFSYGDTIIDPTIGFGLTYFVCKPTHLSFRLFGIGEELSIQRIYQIALRLAGLGARSIVEDPTPKTCSDLDLFNLFKPLEEDPLVERISFKAFPKSKTLNYAFVCHPTSRKVQISFRYRTISKNTVVTAVDFKCSSFVSDALKVITYRLCDNLGLTVVPNRASYAFWARDRCFLNFPSTD